MTHRNKGIACKGLILVGVTAFLLGACAHSRTPHSGAPDVVTCANVQCNITTATWTGHIVPRHCAGKCPPKSIFTPGHCANRQAGITFCNAIINSPNCTATAQPNTYIKAVGTLTAAVGDDRNSSCGQTKVGTVIYNPTTKEVVTQYPGQ